MTQFKSFSIKANANTYKAIVKCSDNRYHSVITDKDNNQSSLLITIGKNNVAHSWVRDITPMEDTQSIVDSLIVKLIKK
jgi:hypothetical protein